VAFACVATQIKGWQMKLTCNSGKLLIAFLFRPSRNSAGISELFIPATAPHHPQCPEKSNAKSGMIHIRNGVTPTQDIFGDFGVACAARRASARLASSSS